MDEKTIRIIPFMGEKIKTAYVVRKFMARSVLKGNDVLVTCDKKVLADDAYETKVKIVYEFKLLNNTTYNKMILAQE